MYYLALQMLFGDRSKYYSMVVGVAFATLIMTQQPSILVGLLSRTYSFVRDTGCADIWVMDPGVNFVEEHKPLKSTVLNRIRGIQGVLWASRMYKNLVRVKLPDGTSKTGDLTGLDNATLIGAPHTIVQGTLEDIKRPHGVLLDAEAANTRLRIYKGTSRERPLRVGDALEINDNRAYIVGLLKATRNFVLQPQMYTTYSQALTFANRQRRYLTYILVKVEPGADAQDVCQRIQQETRYMAKTAAAFSDQNLTYWMVNTGIPINFGISVLLGFLVGIAVVGQTFFNFIQDNIKNFAILKVMGLGDAMLVRVVLLQATVVGFIGYGLGVGMAGLFGLKFHDSVLAFRMPPIILAFSFAGVALITLGSVALNIRKVLRLDSTIVFRS